MKKLLLVAMLAVPVQAQSIDTYELRYYQPGAVSAFQTQSLAPVVCNQDPVLSTINSNPTRAVWDDPTASGRVCIWSDVAGGVLLSLPVGNYEATLVARNQYGVSPESTRAPFAIGVVPGVPTGVRIVR